ncbi:hypothetical protein D0T49_11645 [Paludibacter sp. 221]|uniref:cell division protein FtsL n=1 Tax=Paludibacter sp. 221 TaxID=2302939 RepID=UPI0013D31E54|nr:cell division protein FtsL [Paludibacter sp. 221]NDV47700.1 hypothetical protein [Paludibacter sp. 221]
MNKKSFIIILTVVIAILIGVVIYFVHQSRRSTKEMNEIVEMMAFEKEQLENEFSELSIEYGNYPTTLRNDSLVKLLENEQMKVQQLLEELRITKATNARRIAELRKELTTVRTVMKTYVVQIDSLNAVNTRLEKENKQVRHQYQVATKKVEVLSKERETLSETVARASRLDITNFEMKTLNAKDRATKRYSQIATLEFDYTVSKNITTQPGLKTIYLRITRPDDEVLTKSPENVFPFEDKNIVYSATKEFEYDGEAVDDVIYWKVEEILQIGDYRADFFVDGSLVGSFQFEIRK